MRDYTDDMPEYEDPNATDTKYEQHIEEKLMQDFEFDNTPDSVKDFEEGPRNDVALMVTPKDYRFQTKTDIQNHVTIGIAQLLEQERALDVYARAKEIELVIKEVVSQLKDAAVSQAMEFTGGSTGKVEYKNLDLTVRNVGNDYEYTEKVAAIEAEISETEAAIAAATAELQTKLQTLKNNLDARKKYEESTDDPNEKAKIIKMGGVSLAVGFKK